MSKITTMIMTMSGISLLFYVTGILSGTLTATLFTLVLNPSSLASSPLYMTVILGIVGTVTAASAFALIRGTTIPDYVAMSPIIIPLFAFGWDFLVVYDKLSETGGAGSIFALLLFGPLMVMYVLSVIEWWRSPG